LYTVHEKKRRSCGLMILYGSNLEINGWYFCLVLLFKDPQSAAGLMPGSYSGKLKVHLSAKSR